MTFYFLFEANCSIFVKGALSIVDIAGFYEHVKGGVHMEFFFIYIEKLTLYCILTRTTAGEDWI